MSMDDDIRNLTECAEDDAWGRWDAPRLRRVLAALDALRKDSDRLNAERDAARADLAYLRAQVAALAGEMAEDTAATGACRAHSSALRALIACPTCGGMAWVDWTDDHPGGLCADCTKETP